MKIDIGLIKTTFNDRPVAPNNGFLNTALRGSQAMPPALP